MTLRLVTAALAACVVICVSPQAYAQSDAQALRKASIEIYSACLSMVENGNDAGCACVAGYMGGALSEREYEIAARLARIGTMSESGASEAAIQAEIQAFFDDGFTVAEIDSVNAKMQAVAPKGDMVCAPFEQRNTM